MLISVSTHKGGAGKTTISTNLAFAIAKLKPEKTVLLLDLDGQCGVSMTLGKSPKKHNGKSILSIIGGSAKMVDVLDDKVKDENGKVIENLNIIYSEPKIRAFDHLVNDNISLQKNLIKLLETSRKLYDYVIVDTPPAFSTTNILAFQQSDIVVSPFWPEMQYLEGTLNVLTELNKQEYKKNDPIVYLLPIKVNPRGLIDKQLLNWANDVVNVSYKDNAKFVLSNYRIPATTQYSSVVAKEQIPLILSRVKAKIVKFHKVMVIEILKDILSYIDEFKNGNNSKEFDEKQLKELNLTPEEYKKCVEEIEKKYFVG